MAITIGAHPNNLATWILSYKEDLQGPLQKAAGGDLQWARYADGRETATRLREGRIQVGATGSTPPIVAQAAGDEIVYLARSKPHPEHGGVVVPVESRVQSIADLAGGSIAFAVGSWQTHAYVELLDRFGLEPEQLRIIDIPAIATADDVLGSGADAWLIHDPLLAAVQSRIGDTRTLATVAELVPNRSVFWGRRDYAQENPQVIAALVEALNEVEEWAAHNPEDAASLLTESGRSDSKSDWMDALAHRPWGVAAVDEEFLAEQQRAADLFARYGVIPDRVDVGDALAKA